MRSQLQVADLLKKRPNEHLLPTVDRVSADGEMTPPRMALRRTMQVAANVAVPAVKTPGQHGETEVDQAPCKLPSNPVPPYPSDALASGIEGVVLLHVRIGAEGSVEEASIQTSSGVAALDQSALSTVRDSWRFQPATRHGSPVPYEGVVPIRFEIRSR